MRVILFFFLLFISSLASALVPNLHESGVNWNDLAARNGLLEQTDIPTWNANIIADVNEIYNHPRQHSLPNNLDKQKYNIIFLESFWGPLTNPFVKYARPAKAFVYYDEFDKTVSYMAPIVKNASDGNYYVFDGTKRPLLLEDWVNTIKRHQYQPVTIKINICNGYAVSLKEKCSFDGYEHEEAYATDNFPRYNMHLNSGNQTVSAYRDPSQDWQHVARTRSLCTGSGLSTKAASIRETSVPWNNIQKREKLLYTSTTWPSYKIIAENFKKIRDIRYFEDKEESGFQRRISWLYPDDGCWTRASAAINHFFGVVNNSINAFPRPSKIFAFGNLCANTSNSKSGRVTWWYHTAPLIQDSVTKQIYVLDPAINSQKPMEVEEWMGAISSNTGACKLNVKHSIEKFNVCNGFATTPLNACRDEKSSFTSEAQQALRQSDYQKLERIRQADLGRDVNKVLGDEAPWM